MKNFEEIFKDGHVIQQDGDVLIAGRGRDGEEAPTPHEPYETPDGALYIGYTVKGKEYLYTQEELAMFQSLEGRYTNLPQDDPYANTPLVPINIGIEPDSRDQVFYSDSLYQLNSLNATTEKPNFSSFRNYNTFLSAAEIGSRPPPSPALGRVGAGGIGFAQFGIRALAIPPLPGAAKRAVSINEIKVLDLLSEGEIEGIVDSKYIFTATKAGQIGYNSATKEMYPAVTINNKTYRNLQSVFLNGVPIVDPDGRFNFQQVDINMTNGSAAGDENGIPVEDFKTIKGINDQPLQVVRRIGERLRGPNKRTGATLDEAQPSYFSKFYKILNRNCDGVKIFIRISSLFETNVTGSRFEPVEKGQGMGDKIPVQLAFGVSFRRIYANQAPGNYSAAFNFPIIGKLLNGFLYEYRMPFYKTSGDLENPDFLGFEIKITRYTPDSINSNVQSPSQIDAIAEIYHQKFTYPNSAMVSSKFIAEYFTQVPERTYDVRLLKVKIPSNYDPFTKTYAGDWDGTFQEKKFWTDNPAWCYYDLLTNKRYGLGDHLKEEDIDKWTIYELSKYCDEMVSDGEGGFEPRYVCNVRLSERSDAFNALKNFSSIFRGFTYYMGGSILCTFDAKRGPIFNFTNSNVKNGSFNYQGSSSQSRGNVFLVRYNDQNNFFEPAIEYLEDPAAIKRNGIIQKEINAFGCTKKSYALRYATWMKETENTEIETVSFSAGIEAMLLRPGDTITISDRNRYARRLGGRIFELLNSGASASVTLDSIVPLSGNINYDFTLITPTFNLDPSLITTNIATASANNVFNATGESGGLSSHFASGIRKPHIQSKTFTTDNLTVITGADGSERTKIIFNSAFDQTGYLISGRNPFYISSNSTGDKIDIKPYRIIGIKEESSTEYSLSALEVNPEKYDAIDSGSVVISEVAIPGTPVIQLDSDTARDANKNTIKVIRYQITAPSVNALNCTNYSVFAKKGHWVGDDFSKNVVDNTPPANNFLINTIYNVSAGDSAREKYYVPNSDGTFYFRAYSRNSKGQFCSIPASGEITTSQQIKLINLISINSLIPKDATFFGSAIDGLSIEAAQVFKDVRDKNLGGQKIKIGKTGENLGRNYGAGGKFDLITIAKEPVVAWQIGLPDFGNKEISLDQTNLSYRISAREPSPTNAPSKFIYFEITGFSNGTDGGNLNTTNTAIKYKLNSSGQVRDSSSSRSNELYSIVNDYRFPTSAQLNGVYGAFYNAFSGDFISGSKGPFRNYDIVVEAIDNNGNSSAKYNIFNKEPVASNGSFWNLANVNNNGFDILEIRNPRSAQTILTPPFRKDQAKESIFPSDVPSLDRRNGYFDIQMYGSNNNSSKQYKTQADIEENYATLKLLGAQNNDPTFCITEQSFDSDGGLTLKIKRDSRGFIDPKVMIDYLDANAAIVLFSDRWFNVNTIKNGAETKFTASTVTDGDYNFESYTEKKPIGYKISADNLNTFTNSSDNFTEYDSIVSAKVFDVTDDRFTSKSFFLFDTDINNSKFISVAFLDPIDVDREDIVQADDVKLAVLKRSKFYNFSPAALAGVKGEPDKKTGFRAYAVMRMLCATGPFGTTARLDLSSTVPLGTYPPDIASIYNLYLPAYVTWHGRRGRRYPLTRAPETAYPPYYYPNTVQLEIFSHGVKETPVVVDIRLLNRGEIGFGIKFELEEPIPYYNRILGFGGSAKKAMTKDDDNHLSVVISVPSLQQPPSFVAGSTILDGNGRDDPMNRVWKPEATRFGGLPPSSLESFGDEFRNTFNIRKAGTAYVYEEPVASYFTLASNGQKDGEIVATIGSQAPGKGIVANSVQVNSNYFNGGEKNL